LTKTLSEKQKKMSTKYSLSSFVGVLGVSIVVCLFLNLGQVSGLISKEIPDDIDITWFFDENPPEHDEISYSCEELLSQDKRFTKCRRVRMSVETYLKKKTFAVLLNVDEPPLFITKMEEISLSEKMNQHLYQCKAEGLDESIKGVFDYQPPDWISGTIRLKDGLWSLDPCLRGEDVFDIDQCKTWSYMPYTALELGTDASAENDY
jgi:hypothetical protein